MDGQDSKDDFLKNMPPIDGKEDPSTNQPYMDGKKGKVDSSTDLPQPQNQTIPENKAEGLDFPPDNNNRIYFLDKSADISELTALHQKSGGKAEYTKWRSWNFAQEMENKQKDKLIEQMAARLQEIEDKLQKIQKPGAD